LGLEADILARVHTFGKACGTHGAVIVGPTEIREWLINFSRPFIYSTGPSPHFFDALVESVKAAQAAYVARDALESISKRFTAEATRLQLKNTLHNEATPIKALLIPGPQRAADCAHYLVEQGFAVKAIRHPTVARGKERIRICLHSYNSPTELNALLAHVVTFLEGGEHL
jgi:8-amino-7-oxononanoate synthase